MSTRSKLAAAARERPRYRPIEDLRFVTPGERSMAEAHWVATTMIQPNPNNPRKTLSNEAMNELADSIRSHGILNPITVRREESGYTIIAGDRRFRAALLVGLSEVPCIVRDVSADDAYVETLLENLQREDVPADEEAAGLLFLHTHRGWTKREIAHAIHKSEKYVSTRIRVFEDPVLADPVRAGDIAVSTAEELLKVRDPDARSAFVEDLATGRLDRESLRRALPRVNRRGQNVVANPSTSSTTDKTLPPDNPSTSPNATTLAAPSPELSADGPQQPHSPTPDLPTGLLAPTPQTVDKPVDEAAVAAHRPPAESPAVVASPSADDVIGQIVTTVQPLVERLLAERPPVTLAGRRRLATLNKLIEDVLRALPSPTDQR